jgi:hypothetical protein
VSTPTPSLTELIDTLDRRQYHRDCKVQMTGKEYHQLRDAALNVQQSESEGGKDIPEGRGSALAGTLATGSPHAVARDSNPGGATPGGACSHDKPSEAVDAYAIRRAMQEFPSEHQTAGLLVTLKAAIRTYLACVPSSATRPFSDEVARLIVKHTHGGLSAQWLYDEIVKYAVADSTVKK